MTELENAMALVRYLVYDGDCSVGESLALVGGVESLPDGLGPLDVANYLETRADLFGPSVVLAELLKDKGGHDGIY